VTGYHPVFMALKCVKRLATKPFFTASFGLWIGFLSGYLRRAPQVNDEPLIRWVRDEQIRWLRFKSSIWGAR